MKRRMFLVCPFIVFLRLQNYESIAAIFWQSASYVCSHAAFSLSYLLFFRFVGSDFQNGFPNPFIVRFRSSFFV